MSEGKEELKVGDKVSFYPSGRSASTVTAEITAIEGEGKTKFLVTKDAGGKVRKVRPGAAKKV